MDRADASERLLVLLLRVGGGLTLLALPTMLFPVSWMASIHRDLGLGEFPASPITDYLARSLSGFYALHGGLLLVASMNVRRHRPIVCYLAISTLLLGVALLAIDLHAGMPSWWTWGEGPPVVGIACLMLYLLRSVPAESR